jgi:signal transduction histidine kinase
MTYAEVDASPPSNQTVDLGQALSRAADTCRAAHPDATLHVIADPLPVVRGTADQFQALFRLLIDNAIRFRAGRPAVTVTVRSAVEPEQVSLTLSDDGPGIPAAFHKSAFKLFRRAREDRHPTGFGLGLAMARRIVTRHGGTITLDPGPGGACFRVTLPLAPVEADLLVRGETDP